MTIMDMNYFRKLCYNKTCELHCLRNCK